MTNKFKTAIAAAPAAAVARNSTWTPTEHAQSKEYTALGESLNASAREKVIIIIALVQKYTAIRATTARNNQTNKHRCQIARMTKNKRQY